MTPPTDVPPQPDPAPTTVVAAEVRQRWRITFAREPVAADAVGRAAIEAWQSALAASGLPVAGLEMGGTGRARIAFAAPLPASAHGESELADLWLLDRRAAWQVREALADRLPEAHRWIGAESVWLGAPALAGRVVAADWRASLGGADAADRHLLVEAGRTILAARTLPRLRLKGGSEKRYDLRPLLADVSIDDGPGATSLGARIRTRFDPEAGAGRPEEVVAALAEAAGLPLTVLAVTRERLLLADDVGPPKRR